jgi:PIN domain nuclease of toxin-antitoxin system
LKALLDTHTFLWATLNSLGLPNKVKAIVADDSNAILVSAASAWEIATKVRLGKLAMAETLERNFLDVAQNAGYILLPIEVSDALRAGRFSGDHRDPFDRIIAAQAIARDIPVLSNDARLDAFGVRRIW